MADEVLGGEDVDLFGKAKDGFFGVKTKEAKPVAKPVVKPAASAMANATAAVAPASGGKKEASVLVPAQPKPIEKPMLPRQKVVADMVRSAGLTALPEISQLVRGKRGDLLSIKDIAVFVGKPEGLLGELAKEMPVTNRVNPSAEVEEKRVLNLGVQILRQGRMYQPIQVAKIAEDGRLECTSGRHRMAFLALAYGSDAQIPMYIEDMSLCEARDAVAVANQSRKAQTLEKAELAVLQAVGGDIDADQDLLYEKTCTSKAAAKKYCVFMILDRGRPAKLRFAISSTAALGGALTTIKNVEGFWGVSMDWRRGMQRKDFDAALKNSTQFLNVLVEKFQADQSFEPRQHLSAKTLVAIGKYYKTLVDAGADVDDKIITEIAKVIVAMGDTGSQKSEETYAGLVDAMKVKGK